MNVIISNPCTWEGIHIYMDSLIAFKEGEILDLIIDLSSHDLILSGAVWEGIDSPPVYGSSRSRRDLIISKKTNIDILVNLLATNMVLVPLFS